MAYVARREGGAPVKLHAHPLTASIPVLSGSSVRNSACEPEVVCRKSQRVTPRPAAFFKYIKVSPSLVCIGADNAWDAHAANSATDLVLSNLATVCPCTVFIETHALDANAKSATAASRFVSIIDSPFSMRCHHA